MHTFVCVENQSHMLAAPITISLTGSWSKNVEYLRVEHLPQSGSFISMRDQFILTHLE